TPLATVRTSTSRSMGCATSTFSMVRGFWGPWNTAAFMAAPLSCDLLAIVGLALDGPAGLRPAGEADREVGDARESHLAEHVGRQGRALAPRTIHDDPPGRVDLARVVVRRRVEPELEHTARHVRRAGNEPELAPLADVAN